MEALKIWALVVFLLAIFVASLVAATWPLWVALAGLKYLFS